MQTAEYSPGLEGIIAGVTAISHVNPDRNSLMYRGYDIKDLVASSSYEEVAYLLLKGDLPTSSEYLEFCETLKQSRLLYDPVLSALKAFPKDANAMDLIKAGCSLLALYDPDASDHSAEANLRKSIRLVGQFPMLVSASYRLSKGQDIIPPDNTLGHSENFLYMLLGQKQDDYISKTFDASLMCYADHGFNASTFAGRVTVSTLSDIHSGAVSAIGTLKGSLHGGANEEAMKMLLEIGSPENAEKWILDALQSKRKIMGFGHRAYKTGDPRAILLAAKGAEISKKLGDEKWHQIACIVEETLRREKNILPNVDFPISYIYYLMNLPIEVYTPIFALARISGWTAHMLEQLSNNKLIRPKALYEGLSHVEFISMAKRF
ncbi:MAG: citrate/2-methylcitrate synthase [Cyanobacteria bacterium P01_H01_bin.74]